MATALLAHKADDAICNNEGRDARDVAKNAELRALIDQGRREFVAVRQLEMHRLGAEGNLTELQALFSEHRAAKLLDVNAPEPINGNTLLHQAAELGNLESMEYAFQRINKCSGIS